LCIRKLFGILEGVLEPRLDPAGRASASVADDIGVKKVDEFVLQRSDASLGGASSPGDDASYFDEKVL
jgi:hypothetical protein